MATEPDRNGAHEGQLRKGLRITANKRSMFNHLIALGLLNAGFISRHISDNTYLKIVYKGVMGYQLDLNMPKKFNEKIQWLKLNDRKPIYSLMVDKYEAKEYAAEIIGEEHIIPSYGVWDSFDEIDFTRLPDQFVLKCTNDSGGVVVVKDKSKLDMAQARKRISKFQKSMYFWRGREWPYKNVKPRILAEKYMEDTDRPGELTDYKIHCFNGVPKVIQVITDRFSSSGMVNDHYTLDWEKLALTRGHYAVSSKSIERPPELDEMLELSRALCKNTYYIRTDFYLVSHRIYFGELTLYPASGFTPFHPEKWDDIFGKWIKLPIDA